VAACADGEGESKAGSPVAGGGADGMAAPENSRMNFKAISPRSTIR
jgi:hypothetical protein